MKIAISAALLASTTIARASVFNNLPTASSSLTAAFVGGGSLIGDNLSGSASSAASPRVSFKSTSTSTERAMSSSPARDALLSCPTIPLRDGTAHPSVGFGTYKVGFVPASASSAAAGPLESDKPQRTAEECVTDALDAGYRFLECAEFYGNEREVGKAIAASGVSRDELFLCSKVWTTTIEKGDGAVRAQLERTLSDLGTDYVDLYLIHWPVPGKHVEAYKTLERLKAEGKVRNIGVSNYAVEDYKELIEGGVTDRPVVNQIEINPFLYRKNTIDYFRGEGVVLQSYRSLRDGKAMDHPSLARIGRAHGKSPAQVLGRWCVQHGFVYIPKSVRRERMVENGGVFDFELSDGEMEELDGLTDGPAFEAFEALYRKCVNRDTTKDGTMEGVKMSITRD